MSIKFCCDKFAHEAGHLRPPAGAGMMYPPEVRPIAQFERDEDGTWNINGCCGGGCYVVTEVKFCPFCGAGLTTEESK